MIARLKHDEKYSIEINENIVHLTVYDMYEWQKLKNYESYSKD